MRLRIRRGFVLPALLLSLALLVVTGGAAAAVETDTVATFPRGLWWALSLMATVGFVGQPPVTGAGQLLSALLMVVGFFLLALVGAALATMFVRDEERLVESEERRERQHLLAEMARLHARLDAAGLADVQVRDATPPDGGGSADRATSWGQAGSATSLTAAAGVDTSAGFGAGRRNSGSAMAT